MKSLLICSYLILAAFAGSITEVQKTTVDFSSQVSFMTLHFSLENDLDATGVLELGLPSTGVSLTTESSCKWTQGANSGGCTVATAAANENTVTFNDGTVDAQTGEAVRVGLVAGKVVSLTVGVANAPVTQRGIHGPIKLATAPESGSYGNGNTLDYNPVFGMYAVGGKDVAEAGLTLTP